jgi:hypothetical protein
VLYGIELRAMRFFQIFSKQVTHVICGKANRGEKYLGGCALGTIKKYET